MAAPALAWSSPSSSRGAAWDSRALRVVGTTNTQGCPFFRMRTFQQLTLPVAKRQRRQLLAGIQSWKAAKIEADWSNVIDRQGRQK